MKFRKKPVVIEGTQWFKNGDHPAVVVARLQRSTVVDANTFIVLPPVAVNWTVQQEPTLWAGASVGGAR